MLVVHSYIPSKKKFIVSDNNYFGEIELNDLLIAREKVNNKFIDIKIESYPTIEEIQKNKIKALKESVFKFTVDGYKKLDNFQQVLINLENMEDIIEKKILAQNLSKAIRHPSGLILTRKIMAETYNNGDPFFKGQFLKLADLWNELANKLVRLSVDNNYKESVSLFFKKILEKEYAANFIYRD